jgi:hypothetical protein
MPGADYAQATQSYGCEKTKSLIIGLPRSFSERRKQSWPFVKEQLPKQLELQGQQQRVFPALPIWFLDRASN